MAAGSYDLALTRLLRDEGGYTDHPSDPGGPTNFGITLADARRYWKGNATAADVRAMPQGVARTIYRERYWNAMRCDELPAGVDYAVFDYGVNSGVGRAGKVLRRVLGLPDRSSAVSDDVIAAAAKHPPRDLVIAICAERLAFLQSLKTFPVFGRGWTARVNGVRVAASAMAQNRQPAPVVRTSSVTSSGKAVVPATIPAGPASVAATQATIRAELASEDALQRWWRPLYAFELTFECAALWIVLVHEFWTGDMTAINAMIGATGLLVSYWGFRFGVLGVYVSGRTREKVCVATGQDVPGFLDKLARAVTGKSPVKTVSMTKK